MVTPLLRLLFLLKPAKTNKEKEKEKILIPGARHVSSFL